MKRIVLALWASLIGFAPAHATTDSVTIKWSCQITATLFGNAQTTFTLARDFFDGPGSLNCSRLAKGQVEKRTIPLLVSIETPFINFGADSSMTLSAHALISEVDAIHYLFGSYLNSRIEQVALDNSDSHQYILQVLNQDYFFDLMLTWPISNQLMANALGESLATGKLTISPLMN